jgi:hypothetical protein
MGASFTTAQAYIADVSTPEKRAQNFGIVGAAFGSRLHHRTCRRRIARPLRSTRSLPRSSERSHLLNWLYGYFILARVARSASTDAPFEWKRANPIGSLAHINRYPMIGGLIAAVVGTYLAAHAVQSTWTYYTMLKFQLDRADCRLLARRRRHPRFDRAGRTHSASRKANHRHATNPSTSAWRAPPLGLVLFRLRLAVVDDVRDSRSRTAWVASRVRRCRA